MRIDVHPADSGACGWYRLRFVAQALAAQGHDIRLRGDASYRAVMAPSAFGDRCVGLDQPVGADVVVLQRPLHRHRYELIQALQAQGVAVVVEVDDDFHSIHNANPAWVTTNPLNNADMNRDWLKKSCAIADLVTVSTPSLATRYGSHGRCVVLRNCIPEKYLDLDASLYSEKYLVGLRSDRVTVGWSGSVATHPTDLQVVGDGVARALARSDARFVVVGTGKGVASRLSLAQEPEATGWVPIEAYPEALALLDVGIVPLALTEFNEAKSYLKGLEMAAVGVPFVASPTGEYRRLSLDGIGWVAESPAEWAIFVEQLARDRAHREALAEAGRELVRTEHTVEGNAWRWLEAWESARELANERAAA